MSFSAELKDFVSGFKTGFAMGKPEKKSAAEIMAEEREKDRNVFKEGAASVALPDAPPSANAPKVPTFAQNENEFISKLAPMATAAAEETGLDPRLVVAQAALESGWGKHAPGNNLFGIKSHGREGGQNLATTEVVDGTPVAQTASFRSYADPSESVRDWSKFIRENPRYASVRSAQGLDAQIDALGKSGYATDPQYAAKLRAIASRVKLPVRTAALDVEEEPVIYAASGGMIEDVSKREDSGSNPAVRDAVEDDDGPDPTQFTDIETMGEMAHVGLNYLEQKLGLSKTGAIGEASTNQDGIRALALNVGAAKPDDVETLKRTVDPKGKLPTEELRAIAGWNALYKYHTRNGNAAGAQKAAAAMLMYSKQAAQIAGSTAMAALEDGNKKAAAQAIAAGYESMPDGKSLKITGETDKGVKFQIVDENGDVTDQGEATMDQMMKIATGMQNGTEWFRATGVLKQRAKPDKVAIRQEKERQAVNKFEDAGEEGDDEFLDTLSPQQREAWRDLPAERRSNIRSQFLRQRSEALKGERFETRQATAAEREDYRRRFQMFNTARQQGNWEAQRDQVMDANDRRLALIERDLSDRNVRFQESQEARKKRYEEIDRRILERTATKGIRLSAAERAEEKARSGVELGAEAAANAGTLDAEGNPVAAGFAGSEERAGAVRAAYSYDKAVKENKGAASVDMDETHDAIKAAWEAEATRRKEENKNLPADKKLVELPKLQPQHQEALTAVAAGIGRGNNVPTQQAIRLSMAALDKDVPIKFQTDPRDPQGRVVRIGDNPPIRLGADELNTIALMRGGALSPRRAVDVTGVGSRGASGNRYGADQAPPGGGVNPGPKVTPRVTSQGLRMPLNPVQEEVAASARRRWVRPTRALDIER